MMNQRLVAFFSLMTLVFGNGCTRFGSSGQAGVGQASVEQSVEAKGETPPPVAFLSAEQILKTMFSVTGTEGLGELTDPADDLINRTYLDRSGSLPSMQGLGQATGPTLISITNLASSVCAKAVDRDRATGDAQRDDRLLFREMNFSRGLSGQSSEAVTGALERIARNAWRRDATSAELDVMLTFAQEFAVGVNANDPVQTRLLAVAVCTAALSSVDALTY